MTGSLVSSNLMTLTGSVIAMTGAGYVSDGGNGTTDITATGGAITENATLIAGTLYGSATGASELLRLHCHLEPDPQYRQLRLGWLYPERRHGP